MHVLIAVEPSYSTAEPAVRGMALLTQPDRVTVLTVITHVAIGLEEWELEELLRLDEEDRLWRNQVAEANAAIERTTSVLAPAPVDRRLEAGDAGRTICAIAGELAVDVVVVGSRARHGVGRFGSGHVTRYVLHHAPCPVLAVAW
jgi:nucleotide-binding universal stress UspA family protein